MTICDRCGGELTIGAYPFCKGDPADHAPSHAIAVGAELDYIEYNLGPEAVHITSRDQRKRLMKERGLREAVWNIDQPDGSKSPHTSSWASVDLAAAAALVNRVADQHGGSHPDARCETLTLGWASGPKGLGVPTVIEEG